MFCVESDVFSAVLWFSRKEPNFINTRSKFRIICSLLISSVRTHAYSRHRFSPPKRNVCELELSYDFCEVKIIRQAQFSSQNSRTNWQDSRAAAAYSRGESMVNTVSLEHAVKKACNVFGLDSLNKLQENSVKYIVQEKKEIFVNLPTGFGSRSFTRPCRWYTCACSHMTRKISSS